MAALSVALAVCGLGAASRASAHAAAIQAVAASSSSGHHGLLPGVPAHPTAATHPSVTAAARPAATPPPPSPPASAPAPQGPPPVGIVSLPLVDDGRRVGSGPRVLTTTLWYPAAPGSPDNVAAPAAPGGPYPLIVFAHGYNATPAPYADLLRSWARAGYVVAAPVFPLTNPGAPGGPDESDVVNQPADIRFVIDQVLALNSRIGPLAGVVDPGKIGVAGHSDGGITAAAVAYNTCCRDPRISAAVVMAGAFMSVPGGSYFPPGSAPMLAIQGDSDRSNNPVNSRALYDADHGAKYLLDLPGADHGTPFMGGSAAAPIVQRATLDFLNRYLKAGATAQLLHDASVPGVASILAPPDQS